MTRLAGLILLGLLALPVEASNPNRVKKERPRPTQTAEPPLARPIPAPQPASEPVIAARLVEVLVCPDRGLTRLVLDQLNRYPAEPTARMIQLLDEAEDLRRARNVIRLAGPLGP